VFSRLPPGPALAYVAGALAPGSDVLDLGCGAGRLGGALASLGHRVVAVDRSPEMLARVEGCETVLADVIGLDLGRRFAGVVLASYLVNNVEAGGEFLATGRRHVTDTGIVIAQRYDPVWARGGELGSARVGDVLVSVVELSATGDRLRAEVVYELDGRRWRQPFEARILDDHDFEELAASADLGLDRWLDDLRTWACLVPVRS